MMKNKIKLKKLLLHITILLVFLLSLFLTINIYEYHIYNNNFNKKISSIISKIEEKYPNIAEEELIDVISSENDNNAFFKKYNIDINQENAKEEIVNVENNINIGTKYLNVLMEKYKNKELAVAAYNAGIGTVDTWVEKGIVKQDGSDVENIPFKETNNYVRKILKNYEIYNKLYK